VVIKVQSEAAETQRLKRSRSGQAYRFLVRLGSKRVRIERGRQNQLRMITLRSLEIVFILSPFPPHYVSFCLIRKIVQTYSSARSVFSELSDVLVENALLDPRVHTGSRLN